MGGSGDRRCEFRSVVFMLRSVAFMLSNRQRPDSLLLVISLQTTEHGLFNVQSRWRNRLYALL